MNAVKFFFAFTFFFLFAVAVQAQTQQDITNYDNTEITSPTIDVEQTQINKKAVQPAESNTTRTNTDQTKTETDTYSFYFNHKQFLKPTYRKSAYC